MINLYQLQIFVAVGERGSFSAAADKFNLTQPGVSQHMRTLEDTYKVRLFIRNGPRIEMTEAGRRLLEIARPLVQQAEHLEESFSARLGEMRGKINVVYTRNSLANRHRLLTILAGFHQRYPQVQFALTQVNEQTALEGLLDRQIHFALLSTPPRQKILESLLLETDELVLALPVQHAWHDTQIEVAQLKNQPFLLITIGSDIRRLTEALLHTAGLNLADLNVVIELDELESLRLAIEAGLGIGLANSAFVRQYKAQLGYACFKFGERKIDLKREVYLCRNPSLVQAPSQERFWEYLKLQLNLA